MAIWILQPLMQERIWGGRNLEKLGRVLSEEKKIGASYHLRDVPKFEGSYAEAEIGRVVWGKEKRMVLPFVWEDGKWRVAAAYRDGRSWEGEDF